MLATVFTTTVTACTDFEIPVVFHACTYLAMDDSGDVDGTNHRLAPPAIESASEMDSRMHEIDFVRRRIPRRRKVRKVVVHE